MCVCVCVCVLQLLKDQWLVSEGGQLLGIAMMVSRYPWLGLGK